jgi:hypothetical protein
VDIAAANKIIDAITRFLGTGGDVNEIPRIVQRFFQPTYPRPVHPAPVHPPPNCTENRTTHVVDHQKKHVDQMKPLILQQTVAKVIMKIQAKSPLALHASAELIGGSFNFISAHDCANRPYNINRGIGQTEGQQQQQQRNEATTNRNSDR